MQITKEMLVGRLQQIAINEDKVPIREIVDKKGRPRSRAVGKKGTNMYSPYPGNLFNNGIVQIADGVRYDFNKVGYIGYANLRSSKPKFIEKTVQEFCAYCVSLGGRVIKQ